MRGHWTIPIIASILILSIVATDNAFALTNISTCQTLDIAGETYTLTSDITTSGDCLIITADGITLDGNGHKITGDGSGILGDQAGDIGVDLVSVTGVTVQNMDISFFRVGIFLDSSNGNTITNNFIHQISKYGVGLDSASNNLISSNSFNHSQNGVHAAASQSNGNTIILNTFFDSNHEQVHLHATNDNNLVYNNNFLELTGLNIHDQCSGCNNQYFTPSAGGNYYDDYDEPSEGCNDVDSDGFCDDPFIIVSNNQDGLPFTVQNGWEVLTVEIDIKPDSVNCKANKKGDINGVVPIEISSNSVDITPIDLNTLTLNAVETSEVHDKLHIEDSDFIIHVPKADICAAAGGATGPVDITLTGTITDFEISGTDTLDISDIFD